VELLKSGYDMVIADNLVNGRREAVRSSACASITGADSR
jgi:UDP-glucose 4-epimerase